MDQGCVKQIAGQSKNASRSIEELRSSPLSDLMTFKILLFRV
jgi:hypothetical protein